MPRLNLSELLRRLRERPASAVVFLSGDEEYLRERAVREVADLFLDPATRDFNLDQVRGGDAAAETIASLVATPPMMSDHRVVVVRDAQALATKAREAVERALTRPAPGVVLVIVASIPAGSKAKFYDSLRAGSLAVDFPAPDPSDLPAWIVEHAAADHGLEVDLDAARALAAAIGPQLGILAVEVEKLGAYVGERKRVHREDVQAVGGYVPRVDRWGWFDRVGEKRFAEALNDLPELLDSGETAVGLVIGLAGHLLKVGILVAGGGDALDRHLRANQRWLVRRLQPQARRWTAGEIDAAMADLLRADRLLKSASFTDRQAIEELLLRLALGERAAGKGPNVPNATPSF
jgi:DNA polymerase III subunit delta